MNEHGEHVLAPQYQRAGSFDASGMARVNLHERHRFNGFIDRLGNPVIATPLIEVGEFAPNGLAAAYAEMRTVPATLKGNPGRGAAWGYIDRKGAWKIEPMYMSTSGFGADGVAPVGMGNDENRLINAKGAWAAAPVFGFIGPFGAHGLAAARNPHMQGGVPSPAPQKMGYIDARGKWIIAPAFDSASPFAANGLARVSQKNRTGYIDPKGRWVLEPLLMSGGDFAANGLAAVETAPARWTYIDASGKMVIAGPFTMAENFAQNGLATARTDTGFGVIDSSGKWILQPRFDNIGGLKHDKTNFGAHGLASVVDAGTARVVNMQGEFMPAFDANNEQSSPSLAQGTVSDRIMDVLQVVALILILLPYFLIGLVICLPLYFLFARNKRDRLRE
jgi:hypothetical protein